jgi:hypothetical protein
LVKAPDFLDVWHSKGGRSSAICTGRIYLRRNPWYSFSGAELTPGHMVPSGAATEKIPSDTTGTIQLVVQCLNRYATLGPLKMSTILKLKKVVAVYNMKEHAGVELHHY